jgi:hypothetical protein
MPDNDWGYSSIAQTIASFQQAITLVQSKETQRPMVHLQQSLAHLASLQQALGLRMRIQWTTEQMVRQQQRIARQQIRSKLQNAMFDNMHQR